MDIDLNKLEETRNRLKLYMDTNPINKAKLARLIDISPMTIAKFVNDEQPISQATLEKIENYLNKQQ